MKKTAKRISLANSFGTLGYISVAFQWVWSLLLLCYPVITDDAGFLSPQRPITLHQSSLKFDPQLTPLVTFIAVLTTVLILVITVITLVRLPKTIGKKAGTISQSTARAAIPLVTRHRKVTKKERLRLSYRIILALKCLLVALPLLLIVFVQPIEQLGSPTMWTIGVFAAGCSLFYFVTQQVIAAIGKITPTELW